MPVFLWGQRVACRAWGRKSAEGRKNYLLSSPLLFWSLSQQLGAGFASKPGLSSSTPPAFSKGPPGLGRWSGLDPSEPGESMELEGSAGGRVAAAATLTQAQQDLSGSSKKPGSCPSEFRPTGRRSFSWASRTSRRLSSEGLDTKGGRWLSRLWKRVGEGSPNERSPHNQGSL